MKIMTCKCCGTTKEFEDNFKTSDIMKVGWGIVFDVSNGLTTIKVCEDCNRKIQDHVKAIEDMFQMPFWKLNIPTDSDY